MFTGCSIPSAGSLGGWDIVVFKIPEKKLKDGIDNFYAVNPDFVVPEKWKAEARNWIENYANLNTTIFYFSSYPEEMYYVTFIDAGTGDNQNDSRIAIRGVKKVNDNWKRYDEFSPGEQERTAKRFEKEVITKLEEMLKTKSYINKTYH